MCIADSRSLNRVVNLFSAARFKMASLNGRPRTALERRLAHESHGRSGISTRMKAGAPSSGSGNAALPETVFVPAAVPNGASRALPET